MKVLLNTERHMGGGAAMQSHLESAANHALSHFESRVLRLDAHLSDANSTSKSNTDEIHCNLDAQVADIGVVAVEARAASAHDAIAGALTKLDHALTKALGKHDDRRRHASATEVPSE